MNRSSMVCVTLLVAGAVSVARADVEFAVPEKKAAAAKPAAAAARAAAPAPIIAEKPGMAPPVVPGKQPPAPAAAPPTTTTATWWGHAAWIIQTPGGATIAIDPWLDNPMAPKIEQPKALDAILVSTATRTTSATPPISRRRPAPR